MVYLKNKGITYSMTGSRDGSDGTGDCSGTVVRAVQRAGGSTPAYLYNTDTMHTYLRANGFECVYENEPTYQPKRGDIFIWGKKGQSGGAFGHTGIFYDDNENIIHCNYGYNGVTINNVDTIASANGFPYYYIYRLTSNTPKPTPQPTPTKRRKGWRVDDLQFVDGIWQIKCDALSVPNDFDWIENGINVAYVDRINAGTGAMEQNQTLSVGDYFAFQPSSVGIITKTVNYNGLPLSAVQFPDCFVWLVTRSVKELIYG